MSRKRCVTVYLGLLILLLVLVIVNIMSGSIKISMSDIADVLKKGGENTTNYNIIYNIRIPRVLAAVILGGALALAGYLLQTFFANPIVGPYVLGISSGAKLVVAFVMILFLSRGIKVNSIIMILAAFTGSISVMLFVLLISLKVKSMSVLVVCGIMVGYICSAVTDFVVTFADDSNIVNLHNWSLGSLSGMNSKDIVIMAVIVAVCFAVAFFMSKPMAAYRLGEAYARNLGVNITLLRVVLILVSSLLAACVTAFAGPISFVGIAVPHLMKASFKTAAPIVMIPACFIGGAIITVLCDGIARTLFAPTELSISSVTAVFLVPVVIFMMLRRKEKERS